jgi:predicted Zn-dependent peptidase
MRRIYLFILLILSLVATTTTLPAQQRGAGGDDDKSMDRSEIVRKNLAPVSKDVLKVKFAKAQEKTLSNGLTVLIIEDHRLPLVTLQYNIGAAGPIYEPADTPGLASITASMLREGTKTRTSEQIAEQIAQLGASVGASSQFGSSATVISASGLSDNFEQWFAITNDMLLNPTFPTVELNRLKARLKVQLTQQRASPNFLESERFNKAVYGNHPASVISPTAASIDAMSPEALRKWHDEHFTPQNAVLGITGDIKAADILPKLETWLAGWKKTDLKEVLPPNPKPSTAKKVYLVDRPSSVQTSLMMGNISIDRRDPDYIPLVVMNQVLGGGAAARLFINLREEKGYTYGAYSSFTSLKYPGPWRVYADVRTEVTDGAMTEFVKEIQRIGAQRVPETELEDAKRSLVASFALGLEEPSTALNYAVIQKIYGYPSDYWDNYPAKVMAVTADDVQRVAKKYFSPDTMQIIAVGDASKIKSVMEKYGPVEVYKADGSRAGN